MLRGGDGPRGVIVDSILLHESESLYVAGPASIAIDPSDGSFYIADGFAQRAYRFARTGEPMQAYGRPGGGPGELRSAGSVFPVDDSTVAVDDTRHRTLELFDKQTAESRGRREHGGRGGGQVLASQGGDTIWMPFPDFPRGEFAISMWVPGRDLLQHLGPVPRVYRDHPHYFARGTMVSLAPYRDGFLLGFGTLPRVYIIDRAGSPIDSLEIPGLRRRRLPENILEIMETRSESEKSAAISYLRLAYQRSDGSYVLVHEDPHLEGEWPSFERWGEYYASVLSPDLGRACVDGPLEFGERSNPGFATRGDTLFVLHQKIVEGAAGQDPGAQSWIRLVLFEVDGCDWITTRSGARRGP